MANGMRELPERWMVRPGRALAPRALPLCCLAAALCCCLALPSDVIAQPPPAIPALLPADYRDEGTLAELLWQHDPQVIEARQAADTAASELRRAGLYPNPVLDLGWNTIPIGKTNPPDLNDPLGNVPSYTAGISELIELAKRGPRRAAATAQLQAARVQALAALSSRFFELMARIGRLATSQARAGVIGEQIGDSERLLELDRARADKGEIAAIEVERSEVEHSRLLAAREAALAELESARAECGALLAQPCPRFASAEAAQAFLQRQSAATLPTSWSAENERRRPEITALDATLEAAEDRATLAHRQAIPDPTVRLGYTYDTFVASGDQRQSLALGLQLPLPVANRGQADLQAALATLARARQARQSLVASNRIAFEAAARQRELVASRIRQLEEALQKARALRQSMEGAAQQGGASQVDVLIARRDYQELLLDRTELDAEAYEAALKVRQAAALFPRPQGQEEPNP